MMRPFEIPEILSLICEQARKFDLARLLTTSRLFFDCAVPVIWRSLPESAPMILMKLLPDADSYLKHNLDAALAGSLQPLDVQSLVRFNFYAPYVKQIARHRRNKQSNIIWDRLLKLVDTRPILPKLEVLKISLSVPSRNEIPDPVSYLSAYLSPTLVEIDHVRNTFTSMEPEWLSYLVSVVVQHCPHLHTLKLSNATRYTVLRPVHADELAKSLGRLRNLRVLGLGQATLAPKVLMALGALPNLESLTISETSGSWGLGETSKMTDDSLPHGSFPALQYLGINFVLEALGNERIAQIWDVTTLVQRLTFVSVCISGSATRTQIHGFVYAMCRSSPSITALSLDYSDSAGEVGLISPGMIDVLAQLPLRRLWLWGKVLHDSRPPWDGERFALAFPKMEDLRIRGHCFGFKDLTFMAKDMPQLQHFSAKIKMNKGWPSRDEVFSLAPRPSPSQMYLLQMARPTPIYETEIHHGLPNDKIEAIAA
ncbi:unnamed protein product [Rhizoctonia solani]|uniref:F-box domain-containing protein n=1 Tax=Rhizoctonia solani TaxID=456999 RepID=A0A8H3DQF8_9AGAM|nr:unnamed protein product [Rhizoctonia solani]